MSHDDSLVVFSASICPPPPPTSRDDSLVVSSASMCPPPPPLDHHLSTTTSRPPTTTTNPQPHLCCLYRPPTSHRDSLVGLLPWIWGDFCYRYENLINPFAFFINMIYYSYVMRIRNFEALRAIFVKLW